MGGSKEDRHEPGLEHWSLAVKDGKALEKEWRSEIPIPRGGPHRYNFPYYVALKNTLPFLCYHQLLFSLESNVTRCLYALVKAGIG